MLKLEETNLISTFSRWSFVSFIHKMLICLRNLIVGEIDSHIVRSRQPPT